jgi:membrane carboxypeptidase/penicillin-binding protein
MKAWIGDRKDPPQFAVPANVVFLPVDRVTGAPVDESTPGAIKEAFIAGTQPGANFGAP